MTVLSRSIYVLAVLEALIIALATIFSYAGAFKNLFQIIFVTCIFVATILVVLSMKGFYSAKKYSFKDLYFLFEGIFIATFLASFLSIPVLNGFGAGNVIITIAITYVGYLITRLTYITYKALFKPVRNILIVGAGQDGKLIAEEIQAELLNVDSSRLNEVYALSVVMSDRNEIWWILPTTDPDYSTILIFDYLKKEWVKRKSQKINCATVFESKLYSGAQNGKILNEYNSNTFDGEYIPHYYNMSPLNLGANNTLKVLHLPPRVSYDLPYINTFFVKYIKNFDTFKTPKIKLIKAKFKNFLIWGQGIWGVNYWASKATNAIGKFPTATFKILEIQIYTANAQQNFSIKNIEFSKIKVKQV